MFNKDLKIMLVDDDADDRELFREALWSIDPGIACITVGGITEATSYLHEFIGNLPDMIFLDLCMPGAYTLEWLHEIKRTHLLKDIPVFIYSTASCIRQRKEATLLGAADFFTKPVFFQDIIALLTRVMGQVRRENVIVIGRNDEELIS